MYSGIVTSPAKVAAPPLAIRSLSVAAVSKIISPDVCLFSIIKSSPFNPTLAPVVAAELLK